MATAAAAMVQAIAASGVLVRLEPEEFGRILLRCKDPLVVIAQGGLFSAKFQYLLSYKGLAFYCASKERLQLPPDVEVVNAGRIWIPG